MAEHAENYPAATLETLARLVTEQTAQLTQQSNLLTQQSNDYALLVDKLTQS